MKNFFTSRQGGVSKGNYNSLNLGLHVKDSAEIVCKNRAIIAQELQISSQQMVYCEQVHGVEIKKVTSKFCGYGSTSYQEAIPHTDVLITNEKQVYLTLLFADCIPLFFFDPIRRAVGLAHGGWKGAWSDIGEKTIQAMQKEYGSKVENVQCWIGPGIGPCCFEIGEDLAEQVRKREGWEQFLQKKTSGKYVWNLWKTHYDRLLECGILPKHIVISECCTSCHSTEFFSYRRDRVTGRMAAILGLQ